MSIEQQITVPASPDAVYEILTQSERFSAMSGGAPANIDSAAGGAFSLFGGAISGRNIECVPNQRVVQAWRVGDWPEGIYSIVSFDLSPDGSGTKISFRQSGHPEGSQEHLEQGWHNMYWDPIKQSAS